MEDKKQYFHSVNISEQKCVGCTKCVRVCPTEAIRVKNDKAQIDGKRCIDCGQCVTVCPVKAISISSDPISKIKDFKYSVAVISSSYMGQFREDIGYKRALKALYHIGFNEIAEQAMITDITADIIRDYVRKHKNIRPILSSNCPAIVRLIQVRFPSLLPNLLHIESPISMLAMHYRDKIKKEQGLKDEEIGIFLIVASASQVTAVHQPEGTYKHIHNGAIAIRDIYCQVVSKIKEIDEDPREVETYANGLSWALSGMEAEEISDKDIKTLSVNGIHNVIDILSKTESHHIDQYDYIELKNCYQGCVGGGLNVENPFIAKHRIKNIIQKAKKKEIDNNVFFKLYQEGYFNVFPLEPRSIMELDTDIKKAISLLKKVKEIQQQLPGLDCAVCGCPTCRSLAEDIAQDKAKLEDCIVLMRRKNKED